MNERFEELYGDIYRLEQIRKFVQTLNYSQESVKLASTSIELFGKSISRGYFYEEGLTESDMKEVRPTLDEISKVTALIAEALSNAEIDKQKLDELFDRAADLAENLKPYFFRNTLVLQELAQKMGIRLSRAELKYNGHADREIEYSKQENTDSFLSKLDPGFKLEIPRLEIWFEQVDSEGNCENESVVAHLVLNEFTGYWQAFINYNRRLSTKFVGDLKSLKDMASFFGRMRLEIEDCVFHVKPEDIYK
ncbi:hypothetical protein AB4525_18860 [Vibrio breoganii]